MLWNDPNISLRKIGQQLNVDPLTVKRHASRLELVFPRPKNRCAPLAPNQQLKRGRKFPEFHNAKPRYRSIWLSLVRKNPGLGTLALRKKRQDIYTWLYRHDKIWLSEHKPRKLPVPLTVKRANWGQRDRECAAAIGAAAHEITGLSGRPKQITKTELSRRIGRLGLIQKHVDLLPLTRSALSKCAETREEYALRRISWAMEQFRNENIEPKMWQLIKRSGTDRLADFPRIKKVLSALLLLKKG